MNSTSRQPIYLDYNATTPHASEVIEIMKPFLETHFGNPSSAHHYGEVTRCAVEQARLQIAEMLGAKASEIVFTSGGTESNNYAIRGAVATRERQGRHIITSPVEHPAVTNVCRELEGQVFEVTWLPVDRDGMINVADAKSAIRPDTILITLMHANNEVGTIQPIKEIAEIAQSRGIIFHTDAAQALGKIPTDVQELGVDLLSIAGHKLYAPKGVGALFIRESIQIKPLMYGANQEHGRRPGTENVLEIVGLGKACEIAKRDFEKNALQMRKTRDTLEKELFSLVPDMRVNGHHENRLPSTLSVSIKGIVAQELLALVADTVAASAGAACHSGVTRLSDVLRAMGVSEDWGRGTVRFSTGRNTADDDVHAAAEAIAAATRHLRH